MISITECTAFALSVLGAGSVSAAVPADPWKLLVERNEMTDSASRSLVAELHSNDGQPFELTLECDAASSAVVLGVLADRGGKFLVNEHTTLSGGFGSYSEQTTTNVGVLFRFDDDGAQAQTVSNDYANHLNMIFVNNRTLSQQDSTAGNGPAGAMQALGMLAKMATRFVASGDANDLLDHGRLRVEVTMSNGTKPIISVPLSHQLKDFTARCALPNRVGTDFAAGANDGFNGTFAFQGHSVTFAHGMATLDGMGIASGPFNRANNRIEAQINGERMSFVILDVNHLSTDGGKTVLTRTVPLPEPVNPVADVASLSGTFLNANGTRLIFADGHIKMVNPAGRVLVGSRFEMDGNVIVTHLLGVGPGERIMLLQGNDTIAQLDKDGHVQSDDKAFRRVNP